MSRKADEGDYRIRWARIERCNGHRCWKCRMCIAERRVKFFWFFHIWWPVDGGWRDTEDRARIDIEDDFLLRQALPEPEYYRTDGMKKAKKRATQRCHVVPSPTRPDLRA